MYFNHFRCISITFQTFPNLVWNERTTHTERWPSWNHLGDTTECTCAYFCIIYVYTCLHFNMHINNHKYMHSFTCSLRVSILKAEIQTLKSLIPDMFKTLLPGEASDCTGALRIVHEEEIGSEEGPRAVSQRGRASHADKGVAGVSNWRFAGADFLETYRPYCHICKTVWFFLYLPCKSQLRFLRSYDRINYHT